MMRVFCKTLRKLRDIKKLKKGAVLILFIPFMFRKVVTFLVKTGDVVSKGRDMKSLGTGKSIERHRSLERDWAVFMKH